jgi:membrane associated rhomboid family serine protease
MADGAMFLSGLRARTEPVLRGIVREAAFRTGEARAVVERQVRQPRRRRHQEQHRRRAGETPQPQKAHSLPIILPRMFPVCDVIPPRTRPIGTLVLCGLHSVSFLYALLLEPHELYSLVRGSGVVPAEFAWPQLVTALPFHQGWIHVAGNLLCLWIFGPAVEDALGHAAYLLLYAGAGAAAFAAHVLAEPASVVPLVGASGAVAAVMGVYFVHYPRSQVLMAVLAVWRPDVVEVPAVFFVGLWLVIQLLAGLTSLTAPVAGFLCGLLVGGLGPRRRW